MQKAYISSVPEKLSLADKPIKQKEYVAEKVELSENIRNFDKKIKVHTQDPYNYNSVSLQKREIPTKTLMEVVTSPLYGRAANVLGVGDAHDWNRNYDKVQFIVDWAKQKTKIEDTQKLISWIYSQVVKVPSVTSRRLDDLYTFAKMGGRSFVPTKVVKVVEKIVRPKKKTYNTKEFVDNWMKEVLHV